MVVVGTAVDDIERFKLALGEMVALKSKMLARIIS